MFYFALALLVIYWLTRNAAFPRLDFREAALVLTIKVVVGCAYGYFFLHYYNGDDTWFYHNESLKEYALLKSDPWTFFTRDIFTNGYNSNQLFTIFDSQNSFSKDLQETILIKLLAVFDFFSGGRYYVNVIFYNLLVFWGGYYLFLGFTRHSPEKRNIWYLMIFFFPPLLFWSSGIRKDGLSFALIGGYFYQCYMAMRDVKTRYIVKSAVLWIALFISRSFIAMSLLPVTVACAVALRFRKTSGWIFGAVLTAFVTAFFLTRFLPDSFDLPLKVAERQKAFIALSGGSYVPIPSLGADLQSYLKALPAALDHIFLRPYPSEAVNPLYLLACGEVIFFFALLLLAVIKPSSNRSLVLKDPFTLAVVAFALINYLLIGYTVPFVGAFVRYRSIFEIFFLLVFIGMVDTTGIGRWLAWRRRGNPAP